MRTLGIGAALLAAVPGIVDYLFAVPPDSSAGRRATWHGAANLSAVALMSTVAATRRDGTRPTSWELSAQALAAGLMGFAGYLGGTLVYRNQIGVDRYAAAGQWQERTLRPPRDGQAIDAGAAADLAPNQMALVHVGERRVVIARTEDSVVAFDDHCPHKGGPLSDGTLACGVVQCPWHGSQFDVRTGRVVQGPADTPVAVHRVEEKDGRLWLRLAD